MKTAINYGFPEDVDWLRSQVTIMRLLLSMPFTSTDAVRVIGDKINLYESHIRSIDRKVKIKKGKIKSGKAKRVFQYSIYGKFLREYPSIVSAAKEHGVVPANISHAASGYKSRMTAAGYMWRYNRK